MVSKDSPYFVVVSIHECGSGTTVVSFANDNQTFFFSFVSWFLAFFSRFFSQKGIKSLKGGRFHFTLARMSKFWDAGSSSEEEEDDEKLDGEEGLSGSDSEGEGGEEGQGEQKYDFSSSGEDSAEEKREVRSARVKRYEEMNKILERLRGYMKNQDWDKMWNGTV